jgi:hypothetical protein
MKTYDFAQLLGNEDQAEHYLAYSELLLKNSVDPIAEKVNIDALKMMDEIIMKIEKK